jgi:two-component system C4-dicarboxylate transport response regulator DctD
MTGDQLQPIFFVDDDAELREANVQSLELAGLAVQPFADAPTALARIDDSFDGMIVTDIRMPGMDGLELFAAIRAIDTDIPVILISGHADVPMAVGALREGAFDFLAKPFAADHLIAACERALTTRRLVLENRALRAAAAAAAESDSPLIGDSPVMARLRDTIAQVAKADIDVLVEGETGSGKELVALLLHRLGPRRGKPFVAVNSGALPEAVAEAELFGHERGAVAHGRLEQTGRIESSSGGTLFLDEIDSMDLGVQAKLLRVLEEREVLPFGAERPRALDLRVVAASKRDLQAAVAEGAFREDLFYRLNVVRLRIPPLRERRADIPQLFAHFVDAALAQVGASGFAMTDSIRRRLIDHDWPGNVRELRNFAYTAVLGLSDEAPQATPADAGSLATRVRRFEAGAIRDALAQTGGDVAAAIRTLGLPRKTFYDKIARHGIKPDAFRQRK